MFVSNDNNGTLISGTSDTDSLYNNASSVTIEGNAGDDHLTSFSSGSYVTITGGSGNDTIHSWSPNTLMLGNEGKDFLYAGSDYATVLGGVGDDEIITYGKHSLIYGYEGNDVINVTRIGDYATVIGAEGDDIISIPGGGTDYNEIWYFDGDGDDVVIGGFGARDTLSVVDVTYTVSDDRNDLVVKAGSGSIRFQGMAGQSINIDGTLAGGSASTATVAPVTPAPAVDTSTSIMPAVDTSTSIMPAVDTGTSTTPASNTNDTASSGGTTIIYNIDSGGGDVVIGNNNIVKSGNTWTYNGGNKVINNYQQGEVVDLASDYQGIDFNGSSFYVKSSSGQLEIQNSQDKFISYSAGSTQVAAYSYMASGSGTVDGRGKSQAEIMIGGNNANNQMYAGSGGSSLWGGSGGNDSLVGGDGYDEFFYIAGDGNDTISGAGDNDVVNLAGISLSQISYASVSYSAIDIGFTDGGSLKLNSTSATGFRLEGVTYTANRSTGAWSAK